MTQTHNCKICCGIREHNGKHCLGCATAINRCIPDEKRRAKHCPICNDPGPHYSIAVERFKCRKCSAIMELADFGFVDDRPLQNLMKKEREEQMKKRDGGQRR